MEEQIFNAYGLFWERSEVVWRPGQGGRRQLLGRVGTRRPGLRMCDFRASAGIYILWNDYRAVYVGMARGNEGLMQRLADHNTKKQEWTRFSWFSIDTLLDIDDKHIGWMRVEPRLSTPALRDETLVRQCEALLILALGTHSLQAQRKMVLEGAREWKQVVWADYAKGGVCHRVAPDLLDKRNFDGWA